jgi:hypothetical protein
MAVRLINSYVGGDKGRDGGERGRESGIFTTVEQRRHSSFDSTGEDLTDSSSSGKMVS